MSKSSRIFPTLIFLLNDEDIVLVLFVDKKRKKSHVTVVISLNNIALSLFLNEHVVFIEDKKQLLPFVVLLGKFVLEMGNGEGTHSFVYLNLH